MRAVSIRASVILATFNQPRLLALALCGYAAQTEPRFEIVVADDGSREDTREVVDAHARRSGLAIRHVWQPHRGFWKSAALNRAVLHSRGAHLIFAIYGNNTGAQAQDGANVVDSVCAAMVEELAPRTGTRPAPSASQHAAPGPKASTQATLPVK